MPTIPEIFQRVLPVLSKPEFLDGSLARPGLPFYVCPFDASQQREADAMIGNLQSQLESRGVSVLTVDVFRLMVERMKENDDLEFDLEDEKNNTRTEFLEHLQGILDIKEEIAPAISSRIADASPSVLFLTGIGAAFPVVRAHSLLQNLESVVKIPLVLFFPGAYIQVPGSGATLSLFGELPGDGYYRAYNLLDIQA